MVALILSAVIYFIEADFIKIDLCSSSLKWENILDSKMKQVPITSAAKCYNLLTLHRYPL